MKTSERLRILRHTLEMTQADFAKAIHISNGYIAELENDKKKLNDRLIQLISLTFNVNENWLKTGKEEMFYNTSSEKLQRMISLFNELPIECQDYIMMQLKELKI